MKAELEDVKIAIIGSGFSGLGMAIRLKEGGIEDFVILERAPDVGGTWHHNTYPGCHGAFAGSAPSWTQVPTNSRPAVRSW